MAKPNRSGAWNRLPAALILLDGLTSTLLGHKFMLWLERHLPAGLYGIPHFFLRVPEPLFRLSAVLQALLGALLLFSRR
jgi:hypothetical protein